MSFFLRRSLLRFASRVYRLMLLAYPRTFRDEYSREMMLVFQNRVRDVIRNNGSWALLPFAQHIALDWLTTMVHETEIMPKALTLGAATICLLVVDWFTFHDFREAHTVRDYLTL